VVGAVVVVELVDVVVAFMVVVTTARVASPLEEFPIE
jgi:hypothetical protein